MSERGKYIVIEGNDGTGKSEQVKRITRRLGESGVACLSLPIEEPGGVPISMELRKIIKNGTLERDGWSNVLLFTAARRLNWLQAMKPALDRGEWVVAARSWISTVAYQGYGEGVDVEKIKQRTLDDVGEDYMNPDLAVILALEDDTIRTSRIGERGSIEHPDTFEMRPQEFQRNLENGYVRFAHENSLEIIDASPSLDEVEAAIWKQVEKLL